MGKLNKGLKEYLEIYFKGIFMGIADIIPGISGGTIAFITGIYDRLIDGIGNLNINFIIYYIKGDVEKSREYFKKIDFPFFIPLALGIGTSFLLMSNLIHYMLEYYTSQTYSFFFGLILASALVLYKKVNIVSYKNILMFIIGLITAFLIVSSNYLNMGHSLPVLLLSGFLASCAMILPGISGSFILLFLNQYEYVISLIRNIKIVELAVFGVGAFCGLFIFSKILSYALHRYRDGIIMFLTGLMLGALKYPFDNILKSSNISLYLIIPLILGFLSVVILEDKFSE